MVWRYGPCEARMGALKEPYEAPKGLTSPLGALQGQYAPYKALKDLLRPHKPLREILKEPCKELQSLARPLGVSMAL